MGQLFKQGPCFDGHSLSQSKRITITSTKKQRNKGFLEIGEKENANQPTRMECCRRIPNEVVSMTRNSVFSFRGCFNAPLTTNPKKNSTKTNNQPTQASASSTNK